MTRPKVYLFGRISELDYNQATGWRDKATRLLCPFFEVLSPMRDKRELQGIGKLTGAYPQYLLCTSKAIVLRDRTDLQRCDVALGYSTLDNHPGKSSWLEMGFLWANDKPMVLIADPADRELRENAFLSCLPGLLFVDDLGQAADVLTSLFNL